MDSSSSLHALLHDTVMDSSFGPTNNSLCDFNGKAHNALKDSIDHNLLLTDLDSALPEPAMTDESWSFATDNLWDLDDLPANPDNLRVSGSTLPVPMTENPPFDLTQAEHQPLFTPSQLEGVDNLSKSQYVYGSTSKQGEGSGGDSLKDGYLLEDLENMNEEDNVCIRSGPSGRSSGSERSRRVRLNKGLYTLRSLVPQITKMDKASILGDSIHYVQDLQKEAKDMRAQIAELEGQMSSNDSTLLKGDSVLNGKIEMRYQKANDNCLSPCVPCSEVNKQGHKITINLDVVKMEERTFQLRIQCKKGAGVLINLTRALESCQLEFQNVSVTSFAGQIIKTTFVKTKKCDETMESETVKRMFLEAASNHGFQSA